MKFADETPVFTADEEKIGQIDRVVIDPSSWEVSHLVVEKGFFFPEDKVIPVSLVAEATEEQVLLSKTNENLNLEPFIETEFIPIETLDGTEDRDVATYRRPYYSYPAIGTTASWGTGWFYDPLFGTRTTEASERNVPDDAIALNEGAEVYSYDGEHVGEIESVYTTDEENRITHFVISRGLLFEDYKLIPMFWVTKTEEEKVQLGVPSDTLRDLPDHAFEESLS